MKSTLYLVKLIGRLRRTKTPYISADYISVGVCNEMTKINLLRTYVHHS